MSTRSLTIMIDTFWDKTEEIAVLYRQMDGYIDGHGHELAKFLDGFTIVNGIGSDTPVKAANGANCLAAQLVAYFKGERIGQFYLYPAGTRDAGEEYRYYVYMGADSLITIDVEAGYGENFKVIFHGTPAELLKFKED